MADFGQLLCERVPPHSKYLFTQDVVHLYRGMWPRIDLDPVRTKHETQFTAIGAAKTTVRETVFGCMQRGVCRPRKWR